MRPRTLARIVKPIKQWLGWRGRETGHSGCGVALDGLPDFKYFYNVTGNIEKLETYVQPNTTLYIDTQLFGYDHLHRLTSASGSGGSGAGIPTYTDSYTYTGNDQDNGRLGNLSSYDGTSYDYLNWSEKCETVPSQALPHAVRQAGADYFCYDDNGNMTTRTDGSTVYTHIYDVENRLTEVTSDTDDTVTTFYYDAAGQRTRTVVDTPLVGKTITYYPFPNYEEEEQYEWQYVCGFGGCDYNLVLVGTVKRSTYSLAGQAIATRITDDPDTSNNGLFYFLTDHLGSTTMLTNSSGTPQSNTTAYHFPFGDYRSTPPGNDLTERGFTGHHENRYIKLIYMNARWYDPYLNRFISADTIVPDPANPQSYNRYSYALNNPINFTDPTGHRECGAGDNCTGEALPPPPLPTGVEVKTFYASPYLQEFLELMGINQNSFDIKVHSDNKANNEDLYRYEIGAWILIAEQESFHPLKYAPGSENAEYFSIRGLYAAVVLLQVVQSREEYYLHGSTNLFNWIQENPQSGQFYYPTGEGKFTNQAVFDDYLILAYLVEQGDLPDFLVSYPDTPTDGNPSGRPAFYGHYDVVPDVGEYVNGRESLSVSSWAWLEADWIPSLDNFYEVIDGLN